MQSIHANLNGWTLDYSKFYLLWFMMIPNAPLSSQQNESYSATMSVYGFNPHKIDHMAWFVELAENGSCLENEDWEVVVVIGCGFNYCLKDYWHCVVTWLSLYICTARLVYVG